MIRSDDPIGRLLDDEPSEAHVHELWEGTRARMLRPAARPYRAAIAGALVTTAVFAIVLWATSRPSGPTASSFLALADGSAPVEVRTDRHSRAVRFADGSVATLGSSSRLVPRANGAHAIELELSQGHARFEVVPGGPRRWTIRTGDARVEVVGTIFTVDISQERLQIGVERGAVRVSRRGETHLLHAGERIAFTAMPPALPTPVPEPALPPAPVPVAPRRPTTERASWTALAEEGAHERAWEALGPGGVREREQGATARELLLLADVARLSGHPAEAVGPLERLLRDHAREPQAPLAAIILGRLQLNQLAHPDRAAIAFQRAVELGAPSALDEEVRASLAISLGRAGDRAGADRAARRYLEAYPDGTRAAAVREWLEPR